MFDRLTLSDDLVDCRGTLLARRGFVVSTEAIAEAAQGADVLPRRRLGETSLAADVAAALAEPEHQHLFAREGVRDAVERALLAIRLPDAVYDELVHARRAGLPFHRHAFATAAIGVRMLFSAVGTAPGLPDLAAAALVHDLGMLHVPSRVVTQADALTREDALRIAAHPLTGAYHLALLLGPHLAVAAASGHHFRCGQGYPGLRAAPARSIEVIAVASAFAALTQPRPFRSAPYTARGAADVLAADVLVGHADAVTVKLLVHALRGGRGDPRAVRFGHEREGHAPETNRHAAVAAPVRSYV
jgi:hypothetical protein